MAVGGVMPTQFELQRALYGVKPPAPVGAEILRRQLLEAADHVGAAIAGTANRPTFERRERLKHTLAGVMQLLSQFGAALDAEEAGGTPNAA